VTDAERLERRLERERRARREAEAITERAARESYDRARALELLAQIARAANAAHELEPALDAAIEHVCEYTNWPVGHAWLVDDDEDRLVSAGVWRARDPERVRVFRQATDETQLAIGEGLPGHVFATGRAWWSQDVTSDPAFTRAEAARQSGLRGGFAFPIRSMDRVVGVLEFFTDVPTPPDEPLLDLMHHVGTMLGQVIERTHARVRLQRLANALTSRNAQLQRSNAELEAFAYAASHDLSEPLRMVTSYLRLLQRRHAEGLDEEALTLISYSVGGMERMRALIDALLDFSRAGRAPLTLRDVDTRAVVEVTLQGLQPRIDETQGTVQVGHLPHVHADPVQLGRVFQNLIANGLKFARPDVPPVVRVAAAREDEAWRFDVEDNGIGIDPEQGERIFEMFHRLHSRDRYDGTGLGLALCERVVERHGGRIWVQPTGNGSGSRFSFTIPDVSARPATASGLQSRPR
jgi:signal transduction histidine kinase